MTIITATRFHDFSYGHRVANHESKCAFLHGHNGRVHFTVQAEQYDTVPLDDVGRVMDFSVINTRLCQWVEQHWDHRFLAWTGDRLMRTVVSADREAFDMLGNSIVWVPFNPTAEAMAISLLEVIGPQQLRGTGCRLIRVVVEETRKCSATAELGVV